MPESVNMEDNEARDLASQDNKQGADKRAPDSSQGESVPGGANDSTNDPAGTGTAGEPGEGQGNTRGSSQGESGGASYGGGTGN